MKRRTDDFIIQGNRTGRGSVEPMSREFDLCILYGIGPQQFYEEKNCGPVLKVSPRPVIVLVILHG